jgi:hypothetical protein
MLHSRECEVTKKISVDSVAWESVIMLMWASATSPLKTIDMQPEANQGDSDDNDDNDNEDMDVENEEIEIQFYKTDKEDEQETTIRSNRKQGRIHGGERYRGSDLNINEEHLRTTEEDYETMEENYKTNEQSTEMMVDEMSMIS